MKRKGTIKQHFVQRIPADIKGRAAGVKLSVPLGSETIPLTISPKAASVRLSLRASEPAEVKQRHAQVAGYLERVWQALRADQPVPLEHRQAVALAGELYASWANASGSMDTGPIAFNRETGDWDYEPDHSPDQWEAVSRHLDTLRDDIDPDAVPEAALGPLVDRLLLRKGIAKIDAGSRRMVLMAFLAAIRDASASRQRNAEGDYAPDPKAGRFPEWVPPSSPDSRKAQPKVSLIGLVEGWWGEAKTAGRTLSTYESYASTARRLGAFLKHDDAGAITPADIVAFKDHRLAQGVSPKTVSDSDIAGLRSVFNWAVTNLKLSSNPAKTVKVTRPKATKVRDKGFSPEEASAILSHSLRRQRGADKPKTFAAKRWVPWLCAYTGARVGEMVQLRKLAISRAGA